MIIYIFITLATFIFMEFIAWWLHKYVMHGIFWNLHEDHHKKSSHLGFFERNDSFFVFFAILTMGCFSAWSFFGSLVALAVALGILLYGFAYFFIHDLFIHQRIKMLSKTKNKYLLAVRRAHHDHHKHLEKHEGECFGMLWVNPKYFK